MKERDRDFPVIYQVIFFLFRSVLRDFNYHDGHIALYDLRHNSWSISALCCPAGNITLHVCPPWNFPQYHCGDLWTNGDVHTGRRCSPGSLSDGCSNLAEDNALATRGKSHRTLLKVLPRKWYSILLENHFLSFRTWRQGHSGRWICMLKIYDSTLTISRKCKSPIFSLLKFICTRPIS